MAIDLKKYFSLAAGALAIAAVLFTGAWKPALAAAAPPSDLFDAPVFREKQQSSELVHPRFANGTTNIIFYEYDADGSLQYVAETTGRGDLPFSDYFVPAPGVGKYVAAEYLNDNGNFGCTGLTLDDCANDPHFISRWDFEIVADDATIPVAAPLTVDIIDSGSGAAENTNAQAETPPPAVAPATGFFAGLLSGVSDFFKSIGAQGTADGTDNAPPSGAPAVEDNSALNEPSSGALNEPASPTLDVIDGGNAPGDSPAAASDGSGDGTTPAPALIIDNGGDGTQTLIAN